MKRKTTTRAAAADAGAEGKLAGDSAGSRQVAAGGSKGGAAKEEDRTSVFIRGLPEGAKEAELRAFIEAKAGPTVTCFPIRGDYGLAKFKDEADAQKCLSHLQGLEYGGAELKFEAAKPKRPTPGSAGKGSGGPFGKGGGKGGKGGKGKDGEGFQVGGAGATQGLQVVQLQGLPAGARKDEVRDWVEKLLPGGAGIERVQRSISHADSAEPTISYSVSFRKEANARRAIDHLHGEDYGKDGKVQACFRALARSQDSAKAGRLIVRNLNFEATEKHIRKVFQKAGNLTDVHLPTNTDGGTRGFAFLQFGDKSEAEKALAELNGAKVCGRGVAVDWAFDSRLYGTLKREDEHQQRQEKSGRQQNRGKDAPKKRRRDEGSDDGDASMGEGSESDMGEDPEESDGGSDAPKKGKKSEHVGEQEVFRMKELLGDDEMGDSEEEEEEDDDDVEDKERRKAGFDADEGKTVFVRNVAFDATSEDVKGAFEKFGKVYSVRMVSDIKEKNEHSGRAFVKFVDKASAERTLAAEAEADRKLKELSSVVKKSERKELPAVEGFGIGLKGRRLVVKLAVAPGEAAKIVEDRDPKKVRKTEERKQWMHLLQVGDIGQMSPEWESLSASEKKQRADGSKERRYRINNPNFALNPMRISVRNMPRYVGAADLRAAVLKILVGDNDDGKTSKMKRMQDAQGKITAAKLVRDEERRNAQNERRSRGYGFLVFKDHDTAMKVLEELNNKEVFGGKKRLIVEFALEDKRKLRMQQELYTKHAHKLEDPAKKVEGEDKKKKKSKKKKKTDKDEKIVPRGKRQREKRRADKAAKEEYEAIKEMQAQQKGVAVARREAENKEGRYIHKRIGKHTPDADSQPNRKQRRVVGEMSDDFELRAMERFRQSGI